MMNLIVGQDDLVAQWVGRLIPHIGEHGFGPSRAIGVTDATGALVAGVVYHDYQEAASTIQASVAATTPLWAQRGVIRAVLHFPFEQLKVNKLWAACPISNKRAIKFNEGIGFKKEATLAEHFGSDHAVVMRMFKRDYERIYPVMKEAA